MVGVWGVGVSSAFIQQQTPFPPTTTLLYKGPEKLNNFEFWEKTTRRNLTKLQLLTTSYLLFILIAFCFSLFLYLRTGHSKTKPT